MLVKFIKAHGTPYSEMLGINLKTGDDREICKWFLASILYGAPIAESSATKTYKLFDYYKISTPEKILDAGWNRLVEILDWGGYARYDFKTADKLLLVFGSLQKKYNGSLNKLYKCCKDQEELGDKLKDLGKGIGDVTISIFLRDMRMCWKLEPKPGPLVKAAMKNLGIKNLKEFSEKNNLNLIWVETALLKLGKDFCRKNKCMICELKEYCSKN